MADEINLVEKSRIMDATGMKRALRRLATEIVEKNQGADNLSLVGTRRRSAFARGLVGRVSLHPDRELRRHTSKPRGIAPGEHLPGQQAAGRPGRKERAVHAGAHVRSAHGCGRPCPVKSCDR